MCLSFSQSLSMIMRKLLFGSVFSMVNVVYVNPVGSCSGVVLLTCSLSDHPCGAWSSMIAAWLMLAVSIVLYMTKRTMRKNIALHTLPCRSICLFFLGNRGFYSFLGVVG